MPALLVALCAGAILPTVTPALAAGHTPTAATTTKTVVRTPPKGAYIEAGTVMHYYPGLFEKVARNRGMRLRTDVDGYASRRSCGELGRVVLARIRNGWTGTWGPWRRYQIIDCSARRDLPYQRSIGLILEVDYRSAAQSGFVYRGRSSVQVAP